MKILQAWVYEQTEANSINSRIVRDLGSLLKAVAPHDEVHKILVHVGFHSLNRNEIASAMELTDGRIVLSAAAYYILKGEFSRPFRAFDTPDGEVFFSDANVTGPLSGKENSISKLEKKASASQNPTARADMFDLGEQWLIALEEQNIELFARVSAQSINTDKSYWLLEHLLDFSDRVEVGKFRQEFYSCSRTESSPGELLQTCPPWLLNRDIHTIEFSVRVKNVIQDQAIDSLWALAKLQDAQLLRLKNFGRTSLRTMCDALLDAIAEGPFGDQGHQHKIKDTPLLQHLVNSLEKLPEREADILRRRMGLECEAQTLEQIGESYQITRERVRQLESRAVQKLISSEYWDDILLKIVRECHEQKTDPFFLHYLPATEEWLRGFNTELSALKYLVENFCEDQFHVLRYEGVDVVSELDTKALDEIIRIAADLSKRAVDERWSVEALRREVISLFPLSEEAFGSLVAEHYISRLVIRTIDEGRDEIVSDSWGANGKVLKALEASCSPLHFSEVQRILSDQGEDYDVRRVHNSLGDVAFVFGRGVYGLEKHLNVRSIDRSLVANIVLDAVNSASSRQWHAKEFFDVVQDAGVEIEGLDQYKVNVILQLADTPLSYLGRSVWALDGHDSLTTSDRLDVRQAIIAIIEDAGKPLEASQIIQEVKESRGLSKMIQIHPGEPIVRVGRAVWGLLDRDLSISKEQRSLLMDALFTYLFRQGRGISIKEMNQDAGLSHAIEKFGVTPDIIYGLCQLDQRFATAHGDLIGLSSWGGLRCLTLNQAVRRALSENPHGLSLEQVTEKVNEMVNHRVEQRRVSQRLGHVGRFDQENQRWFEQNS